MNLGWLLFSIVLFSNSPANIQASKSCCSPDIIFIVDITDDIGFSRYNCESHIRQFLYETLQRAAPEPCNQVRAAVIEYGSKARIKFDFRLYPDTESLVKAATKYSPGNSLGEYSNAKAGFAAANILLTKAERGRRFNHNAFVFWLAHSTPIGPSVVLDYVNSKIKPNAYVLAIAIGNAGDIDNSVISPVATSSMYSIQVPDIIYLCSQCSDFKIDYCPTTTTSKATTIAMRTEPTRRTTKQPTTTTTRTTTTTPVTAIKTFPTRTTARRTTRVPTTADQTTLPNPTVPPVPASEFCFQCRGRRNHKDLYADPDECHHYFQCFYFNETYAVGIRRECPDGTFWHDSVLQCMPEGDIQCVDNCFDDSVAAKGCYAGKSCRQFFVCANTASYGMCCPEGTQFNAAACSCDETETCTDNSCAQIGPAFQTTVKPPVQYNATVCQDSFGTDISTVPGETNAYYLLDREGQATEKMYCPDGVSFDIQACRCDVYEDVTVPSTPQKRQALLWAPFDDDLKDHSHNHFSLFPNDGADRDASVAAFGGGSLNVNGGHISIPGLKTFDFRNAGSWCAFFRCEGGSGYNCLSSGGIISNNKDSSSSDCSIIFGTQVSNSFTGKLKFWEPIGIKLLNGAIQTPSNGWNHFCTTYDGNAIKLYLNGNNVETEFTGGFLSVAHCSFVIGDDQNLGTFSGHIDDVLITTFAMSENEINAHRSGNRAYLQVQGFF